MLIRMRLGRRFRGLFIFLALYLAVSAIGGIYLADGSLHPGRRALSEEEVAAFTDTLRSMRAELNDVSITTSDQVILRGWVLRLITTNGNAVLVISWIGR
jgi:hypothetical protein